MISGNPGNDLTLTLRHGTTEPCSCEDEIPECSGVAELTSLRPFLKQWDCRIACSPKCEDSYGLALSLRLKMTSTKAAKEL